MNISSIFFFSGTKQKLRMNEFSHLVDSADFPVPVHAEDLQNRNSEMKKKLIFHLKIKVKDVAKLDEEEEEEPD